MCRFQCTCTVVSSDLSMHPICNTVCLCATYNLGQKVLRFLHFLTHRTPIPRDLAPLLPLPLPHPKLNSGDQK